jgi:hypothetical protein
MHTSSSTTNESNYEDRFARQMSPFFVGPMRAEEFLEHFLPDRPDPLDPSSQFRVGMFKDFIQILSEKESEWYDVFVSSDPVAHCRSISSYLPFQIKIISSRVPKLHIINTSNVTDKTPNKLPFDLKPDCSVYTNDKYKGKGLIFSLVDSLGIWARTRGRQMGPILF